MMRSSSYKSVWFLTWLSCPFSSWENKSDCKLSELSPRQVPFTSTRWGGNYQNVSNCHQQLLVKLINPPSPRGRPSGELTQAVDVQHVRDAPVTHVHFRLVLLPALFHQLFQRLGHDLYQTTTKHVGDGQKGAGREMREPPADTPVFPRCWEVGSGGKGLGTRMGGGERGTEKWEGSSTIPAAEREANTTATTHTLTAEGCT